MTVDARVSPLAERAAELASIGAREMPFGTALNVRLDSTSAAADAVGVALGVPLPVVPNTACTGRRCSVLWLGPNEWLVLGPDGEASVLYELVNGSALAGTSGSVVDVSASRTTVEMSGRRARQILAKGCAIDLHPRSFRVDNCVQTLVGKIPVVLWQCGEEPRFRLLVRCSLADYLTDWLVDAGTRGW